MADPHFKRVKIEDIVLLDGNRYLITGFDPMSVTPQRVYLRDLQEGEEVIHSYEDLMRSLADASCSAASGCAARS